MTVNVLILFKIVAKKVLEDFKKWLLFDAQVRAAPGFAFLFLSSASMPMPRAQSAEVIPQFTKITNGVIVTTPGSPLGGAWGDYDKDGFIDLFVGGGFGQKNQLYRNNGDGSFNKIVSGDIVTVRADTTGAVWGDYDNDGNLDLFVANFADPVSDQLYRGNGDGTFTRVKTGGIVSDSSAGLGVAWADYDRDGWLDLFVANANAGNDFLYRNSGNGTFARINTGPVVTDGITTTGAAWADFDNDGDPDLAVGSFDRTRNDNLFRNDGNGVFTRIVLSASRADATEIHGIAWGDYDNDGDLDLVMVRGGRKKAHLYENQGDGTFQLATTSIVSSEAHNSASASWADYDNDGWLDLIVTGDHGDRNRLFHNNGDGTFAPATEERISLESGGTIGSYGAAWGDYDNDGFLDLFLACSGPDPNVIDNRTSFLYRNNGNENNWVKLRLVGTVSNRSAIGAKVRLRATIAGRTFWQFREISGGSGWTSQDDLRVNFGLGDATTIEAIRIEWPSGFVQDLFGMTLRKVHTVIEPPKVKPVGVGRLMVMGWKEANHVIEASLDLKTWKRIGTAKGGDEFVDVDVPSSSFRFYRAAVAP